MSKAVKYVIATIIAGAFCSFAMVEPVKSYTHDTILQDDGNAGDEELVKQQSQKLLEALSDNRIDYLTDNIKQMFAKRDAIKATLDAQNKVILDNAFDPSVIALDYAGILSATSPRLNGTVIRVGPGRDYTELAPAITAANSGDLILLDEGTYSHHGANTLGTANNSKDIIIVGAGRDVTTIEPGEIVTNGRIRLEGMRIECRDNPCLYLRSGYAHVRDCYITGYNSGAGGSNAVSGSRGCVVLVERCVFEGESGRASGRMNGRAFDLRENYLLFCRQSQFIDNSEVIRASSPCVFDACVSMDSSSRADGIMTYLGGSVFLRDNDAMLTDRDKLAIEFSYATDDLKLLKYVISNEGELDDKSVKLIETLKLSKNLRYWLSLLRHEDVEIRSLALARVEKLTSQDVDDSILKQKENETLADLGALFKAELEYARLIEWYEANQKNLKWDETAEKYIIRDSE